jgi:polyphosphate glucokinase
VTGRDVLAVDVGATSIKFASFTVGGEMLGAPSRRPTPYPCGPERLVECLVTRTRRLGPSAVGLGFPGEVDGGVVLDGANLARPGGPRTEVDPGLAASWRGFHLAAALESATGRPTVVLNDAAMAALGCATGTGTEIVVTLGTGCGLALLRGGQLVASRDVGDAPLIGSASHDEVLGERGRAADPEAWARHVVDAVSSLADEFGAGVVHLAGGNARRLSPRLFEDARTSVVIERGDPALLGAWRATSRH